MGAGIREACMVEGQTNKKTTTAIHIDSRHWNEMALLLLERGFRMLQLRLRHRQRRWTSSIRLAQAQSQSLGSRSSVATWQLPHGSCHLAVVGCRLPNCQVESRFPHVRTGNGKGKR